MSETAKKVVVAVVTDVLVTALVLFAGVGMMNAGCPEYALYVWVLIVGFLLAYGVATLGLRVIPTKEVEGK